MRKALVACGGLSSLLYAAGDVLLLVFLFALGVWTSGERRPVRLTAAALFGYGAISSAGLRLTPMDLRAEGLTEGSIVHIWATILQGISIALALALGAFVHGVRFRAYSFVTLLLCLGLGAWAGVQAEQESPWLGLTERVSIYAWMLWVAVLAVCFLHDSEVTHSSSIRPPS